ncbi:hypothetical protein [Stappia sp. MMSF_3263]|uniref:hypothetical protein n=1 Tax=Stappia sp. MMSF_3263 TaxID=3046693 RepID=UPI00273E3F08|nr:hypothetical protein [Stappia sp. MMSF_3263]
MPYQKSEALWALEREVAPDKREAGINLLTECYEAYLADVLTPDAPEDQKYRLEPESRQRLREQVAQRFSELS